MNSELPLCWRLYWQWASLHLWNSQLCRVLVVVGIKLFMERKTIKLRKGVRGSHNLLSSFCGARNHGTPSEVHKSVKVFGKTRKNGSSWGHRNMLAGWFYSPLIFKLWGLNSLCWLPTCLLKIYFNEERIRCKLLTLFSNHLSVTYSLFESVGKKWK